MKTHLPHGLRAALLAALASVSLSTAYAYTALEDANFAIDWSKINLSNEVTLTGEGDYDLNQYNTNTKVSGTLDGKLSIATETGGAGTQYVDVAADIDSLSIMAPHPDPYVQDALSGSFYVRWKADGDESKTVGAVSIAEARTGGYRTSSYLELDNPNYTYQKDETGHSVLGVVGPFSVTQSVTLVIQNGTFEGTVTAGVSKSGNGGSTYNQAAAGSALQINGGTFNGMVVAGNSNTTNYAAQTNGTDLVIRGGEFNSLVMGGNLGEKNTFRGYGAHVCITGGTFHDSVYGAGAGGTIPLGVVGMDILGGRFYNKDASTKSGIYALGSGGTIGKEGESTGHISLDIGCNAWFESGYTISAGSTNGEVAYYGRESTVTLTRITDSAGSLATDSTITVDGGQQKSDLMIENVTTAIKAKLTNFKSITVRHYADPYSEETRASDLTLTQDTNADLGGAESVTIVSGSALTLETGGKEDWDWGETTLSGEGDLKKTGEGKAVVQKASGFTGDIAASGGTLQLDEVTLTTARGRKVTVSNGAVVDLVKVADGADAALKELNISGNGKVGVYLDGTPLAGENDANVGKLTLKDGNKIVIGPGGGTLEANLATQAGSILDFTAGATLTMGCTLDVQDGTFILLGDEAYNTLAAGGSVTLFNGVDNVINPEMEASNLVICKGAAEGAERLTAEVYFYTDDQKHGILAARTPEPTTGTLSLLALAGLAARRRRKS